MANGKPGDHPLTDILVHNIEVYGPEADDFIRGISEFSSRHELYQWWNAEINWCENREERQHNDQCTDEQHQQKRIIAERPEPLAKISIVTLSQQRQSAGNKISTGG